MSDPLLDLIGQLPSATVDPDRAHQVRVRCQKVLHRRARSHDPGHTMRSPAWSLVTVGLAALYLTEALGRLLAIYGVR